VEAYDLLLSPHPDDVVYSAFSILSDGLRRKVVATPFNVSDFSRLKRSLKLPREIVSLWRTTEDRIVMRALGVQVTYLFLPDSLIRGKREINGLERLTRRLSANTARIIAPLGVGGHADHIAIRDFALRQFRVKLVPELVLYEDLPYAAESQDLEKEEKSILLSLNVPGISAKLNKMDVQVFKRKIKFSKLYFSQSDRAAFLERHARFLGSKCGAKFAERFYTANSVP
jgi:LmbE family N-acetylglucosaminyl deacetylase